MVVAGTIIVKRGMERPLLLSVGQPPQVWKLLLRFTSHALLENSSLTGTY